MLRTTLSSSVILHYYFKESYSLIRSKWMSNTESLILDLPLQLSNFDWPPEGPL